MIHNASGHARRMASADDMNPMRRGKGGWMDYEQFAAACAAGEGKHGS